MGLLRGEAPGQQSLSARLQPPTPSWSLRPHSHLRPHSALERVVSCQNYCVMARVQAVVQSCNRFKSLGRGCSFPHCSPFLETNLFTFVDGPAGFPDDYRHNVIPGSHDRIWPAGVCVISGFLWSGQRGDFIITADKFSKYIL